jgi:hypothetical protein
MTITADTPRWRATGPYVPTSVLKSAMLDET